MLHQILHEFNNDVSNLSNNLSITHVNTMAYLSHGNMGRRGAIGGTEGPDVCGEPPLLEGLRGGVGGLGGGEAPLVAGAERAEARGGGRGGEALYQR